MRLTRSRARSIGWAMILAVCFALTLALTFKVNAVKSQVRLTERRLVQLRAEKTMLETEFETRANQQQLTALNAVEFGYQAPTAGQYLETERDLAALGKPRGPGAPDMIRVAAAEAPADESAFPAMVNPLTGKAMAAETPRDTAAEPRRGEGPQRVARVTPIAGPAGLVQRLSHVEKSAKPGRAAVKTTRVALEE
ncbi:hypothetical protein ACFOON_04755 [Novosphingobium piscinae]|uniref:Uncharacterized protein n=1 Tax=Novosphingobium piscinae TaxID=1507448 RepID=A0A7X1KPD7_9SPHN|nr:hypothetical protein [Novosphingobium piscinae]MBC2668280.1 hypothetical protein [Novosphingobium piscinae]